MDLVSLVVDNGDFLQNYDVSILRIIMIFCFYACVAHFFGNIIGKGNIIGIHDEKIV